MSEFTSSTVILVSLLAGLLVFAIISNVIVRNPLVILIRRLLFACAIFGLSFTAFQQSDPLDIRTWIPPYLAAGVTLVLSATEMKGWWGLIFGSAWSISMLGIPEADIAGVVSGIFVVGGLCAGIARLSAWLSAKLSVKRQRLKEQVEKEKTEIIAMIDEALGENRGEDTT